MQVNSISIPFKAPEANLTVSKRKLLCLLGLVLYRLALDFAYSNIIAVIYDYQNFRNEPTGFSLIISWVFFLALSPLVIHIFLRPTLSSNIVSVLVLVSMVPTTTMIAFNGGYEVGYVFLMFAYWALFLSGNLLVPTILLQEKVAAGMSFVNKFLAVLLCATIVFISWKYTGFRFHFGLLDVYDLRAEAREYDIPVLLGYIVTAADNILPILLVYYLVNGKKLLAALLAFFILMNFGIAGSKSVLFLLFFALLGYFFVKGLRASRLFVWVLLAITFISIVEYLVFDTFLISAFFSCRILFIPAKLNYVYYDFFSTRELDYFRQSALKWLVKSPYSENIGFIIGEHDINDITARANNGLFSDAYMNFGALGILFFPFILIAILKTLEGSIKGLDERLLFIIVTSVSLVLLSLPFTTALLTSGILVMIFFLFTLPRSVKR